MRRSKPLTAEQKMNRYRQRLRRSGLRPVQVWVPDTRSASVAKALRRQSLRASKGADEKAVLDFLEQSLAWTDGP